MSNGGYKGASPARETSPEQYPGVWELTEQFQAQADGNWPFQAADCAPKCLRFDTGDTPYLEKTFVAAGNRRIFTWSSWFKKCHITDSQSVLFSAYGGSGNAYLALDFRHDQPRFLNWNGSSVIDEVKASAKLRDPSAWYSIVWSVNTNEPTDADKVKLFINGIRQTQFETANYPTTGADLYISNAIVHEIGRNVGTSQAGFDGLMSEVHFIDGQALSCDEFGFFDGQGIWQPKRFTGDFADGKNYSGRWQLDSGSSWISGPEKSFDGILGNNTQMVRINGGATWTAAESIPFTTLRIYGFDAGSGSILVNGTDVSSQVQDGTSGWGWNPITGITSPLQTIRITGTTSITTGIGGIEIDGNLLLDATVGRNSFHLDFSDDSSDAAVGYDQSGVGNDWTVNNLAGYPRNPDVSIANATGALPIRNTTGTYGGTVATGNRTDSQSGLQLAMPLRNGVNDESGNSYTIANTGVSFTTDHSKFYGQSAAFFDSDKVEISNATGLGAFGTGDFTVEAYVKFTDNGHYYGRIIEFGGVNHNAFVVDGTTAPFRLRYDAAGSTYYGTSGTIPLGKWTHVAVVRNSGTLKFYVDGVEGGSHSSTEDLSGGSAQIGNYLGSQLDFDGYMQDLRVYSSAKYTSNFTPPNNPTNKIPGIFLDLGVDSPVNGNEASTGAGGQRKGNYCCLNPLDSPRCTLSNGNMDISCTSSSNGRGTVWPSSGKWYFEFDITTYGNPYVGIASHGDNNHYVSRNSIAVNNTGNIYYSINSAQTYPGYSVKLDAIGSYMCAFDLDNGKIWWGKDGTWYETTNSANNTIALSTVEAGNGAVDFSTHPNFGKEWTVQFGTSTNTSAYAFNAGQRAFKFASSVPSGFSPLATSFMAEPTIKRGDEAMDTALWTGNSSSNKIGNLRLSPSLVWIKNRDDSSHHHVYDIIRGAGKRLKANENHVEDDYASTNSLSSLLSFNDDGFTVGDFNGINGASDSMVGWAWDAGETTATVAVGALNSSYYNQSATWSNLVTGTLDTQYGNNSASAPFDGDTGSSYSDGIRPTSGNYLSMNFGTTFANATSVKIYGHASLDGSSYAGANENLKINGTAIGASDWANNGGGSGQSSATFTLSGGLTSLEWGYSSGSQSTGYLYLQGIEVDGKLLTNTGVTITNNFPSIATTVRARPETGFSILNYSASGTAGASVAHQLGKAPEFMIAKARNHQQNWFLFHKTVGAGGGFNFNDNTAAYTTDTGYWNGVEPDSNKITLGNYHGYAGTHDFVLYAFTSVEGYSSFGTYEGSTTNIPYIYLGFSPRWILIANMDNVNDYVIYDTARDANNQSSTVLAVNSNNPESSYSSGYELDILSNGFKIRASSSGAINQNSHTHVYAAFASHPFASNARAR